MELRIFIHISFSCSSDSTSTFSTEETTGCASETAKGANKVSFESVYCILSQIAY